MTTETKARHTPGPWTAVEDGNGTFDIAATQHFDFIAEVHTYLASGKARTYGYAEAKANARLIAAAPQLFEALQAFYRWRTDGAFVEEWHAKSVRATDGEVSPLEVFTEQARVAITAALGADANSIANSAADAREALALLEEAN